MKKDKSPYSAAFTGCSFMMYEMNRMLPLFLAENSDELIRQEIEDNRVLMVNTVTSRKKYILELKRRFESVPRQYWEYYMQWSENEQRLGLLYVLLRTYRIVLDFHLNVALRKWHSIDHRLSFDDVATELSQIAANDTFVDSWSTVPRTGWFPLILLSSANREFMTRRHWNCIGRLMWETLFMRIIYVMDKIGFWRPVSSIHTRLNK